MHNNAERINKTMDQLDEMKGDEFSDDKEEMGEYLEKYIYEVHITHLEFNLKHILSIP